MVAQAVTQPTVGHVMRRFLLPTETFIGNQITMLRNYRPVVLCHHRHVNHSYQVKPIYSVQDMLPQPARVLDQAVYRVTRQSLNSSIALLAKHAQQEQVKLLHFHYLVDARFLLALKRQTGLPSVVSIYGYDVSSFPKWYGGYGQRYLAPVFHELDMFLAMSEDMRQDLLALGCPDERIVVHYYGSETARFAYPERVYADKDEVHILVCGTLEVKKAQHLVLEALRLVEQRNGQRRFRVTLVGDGPMRAHLEQQVAAYGWQDRVTFTGLIPYHTQALVDTYRQADIFSLPSITVNHGKEGIPGTVVEAMAAGLPVVSTYHAGIPAIIESGHHGLLVRESDIEAMARAFAVLIENTNMRAYLGRAAARRATTELDVQHRTMNLETIYHRLLSTT